jgi:hypothetical protein
VFGQGGSVRAYGIVDQRRIAAARQRLAQRTGRQQKTVAAEPVIEDHQFGVAGETVVLQAVVADDHVDSRCAAHSACAPRRDPGRPTPVRRYGARSAAVRRRRRSLPTSREPASVP